MSVQTTIVTAVRSLLLSDTNIVEAIGQKPSVNKIAIANVFEQVPPPYIQFWFTSGGEDNDTPAESFDMTVRIEVLADNINKGLTVHDLVENKLRGVELPITNGWKFYAPVRIIGNGYIQQYKRNNIDFFEFGSYYRFRAIREAQ